MSPGSSIAFGYRCLLHISSQFRMDHFSLPCRSFFFEAHHFAPPRAVCHLLNPNKFSIPSKPTRPPGFKLQRKGILCHQTQFGSDRTSLKVRQDHETVRNRRKNFPFSEGESPPFNFVCVRRLHLFDGWETQKVRYMDVANKCPLKHDLEVSFMHHVSIALADIRSTQITGLFGP